MIRFCNLFTSSLILPAALGIILRNYSLKNNKFNPNPEKSDIYAKKISFLELQIKKLSEELKISEPKLVVKTTYIGVQPAIIGIFPTKAVIVIDSHYVFKKKNKNLEFLIAHELSHIQANDFLWGCAIRAIAGVIMTLAMTIIFPGSATTYWISPNPIIAFSGAASIGAIAGIFAEKFWMRRREECADKLAYSICSNEAKEAAHQDFHDMRLELIKIRNEPFKTLPFFSWLKKLEITEDGEVRFQITHPSFKTREAYLQQLWLDDVKNGRV